MRLHNTLTRSTEQFEPQSGQTVSLYTCGPTVYNYYHIGNLRNAVFNDTLRRALMLSGFEVKHVMNITDVGHLVSDADSGEDKLEKGAKAEGKTVFEVAAHYTDAFKKDMQALNILAPNGYHSAKYKDTYARATEFIDSQIDIIKALFEKGFVYQTDQAIYFDVQKLPDYGKLTGQKLADKETAARSQVVEDPAKHHPQDFAVWFFTVGRYADHSMHWDSPWGDGFPGWHLECSAIIHATLSDPIDIHTGGIDHIGTHHPNEMAQTEAAFGHDLARFWVHNEFNLIDGTKMSKSKGNAFTLQDVTEKGFAPLSLRLLYLMAHYRSELNFTWDSLAAAQSTLLGLTSWSALIYQPNILPKPSIKDIEHLESEIIKHMSDDLDSAGGLAALQEFVDKFGPTKTLLEFLDKAFGLELGNVKDVSAAVQKLIAERETARSRKDWAEADKLRAKLENEGVGVEDTHNGPRWKYLSVDKPKL